MAKKEKKTEFRTAVEKLKVEIRDHMVSKLGRKNLDKDQWLRTLYDSYNKRFLSDNNRIWTTGSIMIPLSLAGFAALPTLQCPPFISLLSLALASTAVIVSWLLIAENHAAFQEKSLAWIIAIEETVGLKNTGGAKITSNLINRIFTFKAGVQFARWGITAGVIAGWFFILTNWPFCAQYTK